MFDNPSGVGAAGSHAPSSNFALAIRPGFVVAIPVKDEEERLPACLRALAQQCGRSGRPLPGGLVRIVLFANNCTDQSASLARKLGGSLSLDVRVVEARLPPAAAHAGNARRTAMDLAEAWLAEGGETDGVILTTDADSQVGTSWIAENLAAFEAGADAVLGRIDLDEEGKLLPEALHQRGELEDAYERLLTELSSLLDPREHNPWPHHATISGASLGITCAAYCRVGRLPCVPLGEDKALIALLSRHDGRIRYCPTAPVITSGRTDGRAPGGVAHTLAIRSRQPDAFCDGAQRSHSARPLLAPRGEAACGDCTARAALLSIKRGRPNLKSRHATLMTSSKRLNSAAPWDLVEDRSPLFARRLLRPAELPEQISQARRWLPLLREGGSGARQDVQAKFSIAIRALDDPPRPHSFEEESGSLIAT